MGGEPSGNEGSPAPRMGGLMDRLIVTGGGPLFGAIPIGGAKNSALKLMAASLLAPGRTVIDNVPRIVDCWTMAEVLEHLGAFVAWDEHTVTIDTGPVDSQDAPYELVSRMRASIIVLGRSWRGSAGPGWPCRE